MPNLAPIALNLPEFEPGTVWLVGAGPGDPGRLSLLAVFALQQADVIVYDALVSDEVLALARPDARREFAAPSIAAIGAIVDFRSNLASMQITGGAKL